MGLDWICRLEILIVSNKGTFKHHAPQSHNIQKKNHQVLKSDLWLRWFSKYKSKFLSCAILVLHRM